jgi:hypothetical protein
MKFGLCMEGNEAAFEKWLLVATQVSEDFFRPRQYVEIGAAAGETWAAARQINPHMRSLLIDVENGWSLDSDALGRLGLVRAKTLAECGQLILEDRDVLSLFGASRTLTEGFPTGEIIDFAFIDGCHGAPCVKSDFINISRHVRVGSIVAFHDATWKCQGHHMQPHCKTPIDVRRALQELGLLENKLEGWEMVEETDAPHGICFFRFNGYK